jgi:hypothetical protein
MSNPTKRSPRLCLEALEDRSLPSAASTAALALPVVGQGDGRLLAAQEASPQGTLSVQQRTEAAMTAQASPGDHALTGQAVTLQMWSRWYPAYEKIVHIANVWIEKAYYEFPQTYSFDTWERIHPWGTWEQVRYDLRPTSEPGKFEIWGAPQIWRTGVYNVSISLDIVDRRTWKKVATDWTSATYVITVPRPRGGDLKEGSKVATDGQTAADLIPKQSRGTESVSRDQYFAALAHPAGRTAGPEALPRMPGLQTQRHPLAETSTEPERQGWLPATEQVDAVFRQLARDAAGAQ